MKTIYTTTIIISGALASSCWATGAYAATPVTAAASQQYVSANSNQTTPAAAKKNWQKPRVHGRGNGDLALIVMNGKANAGRVKPVPPVPPPSPRGSQAAPKQFPGMDWKGKPKTTSPATQRPPRGTRTLPGMTWKPKSAN
ncbi:MAG: hypothetical protein P1U34_11200 [Coxiellaceae bacterium]|nr:hypothetical protein [Coxiellaceae bacterium]